MRDERTDVTARTDTGSIETEAEPGTDFALLADLRNLPAWPPGFADAISGDGSAGARRSRTANLHAIVSPRQGALVRAILGYAVRMVRASAAFTRSTACPRRS